jgi:hypothetical protein
VKINTHYVMARMEYENEGLNFDNDLDTKNIVFLNFLTSSIDNYPFWKMHNKNL